MQPSYTNTYGATYSLLTDSKGNKLGKSTANNQTLWMDASKTTPYELYQYLLNVSDDEVLGLLQKLTFISTVQIEKILEEHLSEPHKRFGQKQLAFEVTSMVHGEHAVRVALGNTESFFKLGPDDLQNMNEAQF